MRQPQLMIYSFNSAYAPVLCMLLISFAQGQAPLYALLMRLSCFAFYNNLSGLNTNDSIQCQMPFVYASHIAAASFVIFRQFLYFIQLAKLFGNFLAVDFPGGIFQAIRSLARFSLENASGGKIKLIKIQVEWRMRNKKTKIQKQSD